MLIQNLWNYTSNLYSFVAVRRKLQYDFRCMQASEGSFVRRSAASMLSGKKPVQSAVSIFLFVFLFFNSYSMLCSMHFVFGEILCLVMCNFIYYLSAR